MVGRPIVLLVRPPGSPLDVPSRQVVEVVLPIVLQGLSFAMYLLQSYFVCELSSLYLLFAGV